MPNGGVAKLGHGDILTYEEILRLVRIAVDLGVDKIRITGGEPLVRKGICEFLSLLTSMPGLKDVSLTTNGVHLKDNLEKLRSAGIQRLNVSLDTLRREKFKKITGRDCFRQVWDGINLAKKSSFHPIKINVVIIKGLNDDEILDLAKLSLREPYHVRFIEYMPIGVADGKKSFLHVPNALIKKQLNKLGKLVRVSRTGLDGPAERFRFPGANGEVGFIGALSNHFCSRCNRLRLTSTGKLRPCLLSDTEFDLGGALRNGASDNELVRVFLKAAFNKPLSHYLASDQASHPSGQMSAIGG
jgi:cyclic pyranopterin phosphate synthase